MADVVGGSIVWNLDADDSKFNSALSKAKSTASTSAKDIDKSISSIGDAFKNAEAGSKAFAGGLLAIGTAAAGAAGYGVKIAGDLEAARQGFVALLGSADKADDTISRIKKEAAATPFELTGLITGAQALTAVTKDGNQAVDILMDVGKAIATSGKGQAELDRVVLNLQQISSTGKVTAMDIRQFQSAIPMFNDIIASAGLTVEGLQDSENAANLLFGAFQKAGAEGGITAQGFASQAGTFNQQLSNLKDNATILSSEFVKQTGIFDAVKEALGGLNTALGDHQKIIDGAKATINFVKDTFPIIAGGIIGALVPAFGALAVSIWATLAPLLPFIAAGIAIGLLVKGIIEIVKHWGEIMTFFGNIISNIGKILSNFGTNIKNAFSNAWNSVMTEISSWPSRLLEWGKNLGNSFIEGIKQALLKIKDTVSNALNSVKSFLEGHSPPIAGPFKNIDKWGMNIGQAWVDGVKTAISDFNMSGFNSSISGTLSGDGIQSASGNNQYITFETVNVKDEGDIDSMVRELGFLQTVTPGVMA